MRKDIKKVTGEAGVSQRDGQKSRVAGVLILQVAVFIQSLSGVFSNSLREMIFGHGATGFLLESRCCVRLYLLCCGRLR